MKIRILTIYMAFMLALTAAGPACAASLIRDEEIEQDLRAFSAPVFRQAGISPSAVNFVLVDQNDLNAFVAGGQNIFIFTGLILRTASPDELVGVIAHETGHIANGDLIRIKTEAENISMQVLAATLLGIAVAAGTGKSEAGVAAASAAESVGQRQLLRHSRMQETAADQSGVNYLLGAQLPVSGMLSFMEKLQDQELLPDSQQIEYVRTHPLTIERVSYLQGVASSTAKRGYAFPPEWTERHRRMVAKLKGFLFPDQAMLDKGNDLPARYGRAIALYRKGRIADSLKILDPLMKEEPKNPYFYELKGQMMLENGRVNEALAPYARAAELMPSSALIRTAYAHALLEAKGDTKKNQAEAVKQLTQSLHTEPQNIFTHHLLGIAYGKQGNEGLSRLHLAEEQLLKNNTDLAIREAKLAQASLPKNSASWLRAQDILSAAKQAARKKKGD